MTVHSPFAISDVTVPATLSDCQTSSRTRYAVSFVPSGDQRIDSGLYACVAVPSVLNVVAAAASLFASRIATLWF